MGLWPDPGGLFLRKISVSILISVPILSPFPFLFHTQSQELVLRFPPPQILCATIHPIPQETGSFYL